MYIFKKYSENALRTYVLFIHQLLQNNEVLSTQRKTFYPCILGAKVQLIHRFDEALIIWLCPISLYHFHHKKATCSMCRSLKN